jgi:hypothetical protein
LIQGAIRPQSQSAPVSNTDMKLYQTAFGLGTLPAS